MSNSFSFPRKARLTKPDEFKLVFTKSKKIHLKEFVVYCHRQGLEKPRLGLAVSKKVDKKAVTRNRIKRMIRESFRIHQSQLSGWDIVVVAKVAVKSLTNQQLAELLESVWPKIGLKCEN